MWNFSNLLPKSNTIWFTDDLALSQVLWSPVFQYSRTLPISSHLKKSTILHEHTLGVSIQRNRKSKWFLISRFENESVKVIWGKWRGASWICHYFYKKKRTNADCLQISQDEYCILFPHRSIFTHLFQKISTPIDFRRNNFQQFLFLKQFSLCCGQSQLLCACYLYEKENQ